MTNIFFVSVREWSKTDVDLYAYVIINTTNTTIHSIKVNSIFHKRVSRKMYRSILLKKGHSLYSTWLDKNKGFEYNIKRQIQDHFVTYPCEMKIKLVRVL